MNQIKQAATRVEQIADVQGIPDTRGIAIDRVGIKRIRHPVRVRDIDGREQHTIATFSMYVQLPAEHKGTHMSRFVDLLNQDNDDGECVLDVSEMTDFSRRMAQRLDSSTGDLEARFTWFIDKPAPVTGIVSKLEYEAGLHAVHDHNGDTLSLRVVVPVTSLCPCSREISEYGAHNQRSHITLTARTRGGLGISELIRTVEAEGSCELYGLLKRPDEKYVTERAYDNPKFVEDIVRDVAGHMDADDRILGYTLEAENFESIHNHSAYAYLQRNKDD